MRVGQDAPVGASLREQREGWGSLERLLAMALVFAVAIRVPIFSAISPGVVLALALTPLLLPAVRRSRAAVALFVLAGLALLSGIGLSWFAVETYRIDTGNQLYGMTFFLGVFVSIAAVLWARTRLDPILIVIIFGCGSVITAALGDGVGSANPWKFALAVPVAMVALGLAAATRHRGLELVVLIMLGGVSVLFDSRSYLATFGLAAILVIWQLRPSRLSRRAATVRTAVLMLAAAAAVYLLGTELLVGGALGTEAQQRSIAQLDTAGNLLLGGRPELGAFLSLFAYRPLGFGFGVILDLAAVNAAKTGMAQTGYDPENGYVERFMFGTGIELHSVTGDLWAVAGPAGLALAGLIAVVVIMAIVHRVATGTGSAAILFLACWTGWNLLFSPLISAAPSLILLLGLSLGSAVLPSSPRNGPDRDDHDQRENRPAMIARPRSSAVVSETADQPRSA